MCPWPPHTHGAGLEVHLWGAVGVGPRLGPVPGAIARPRPSRRGPSPCRRRPGSIRSPAAVWPASTLCLFLRPGPGPATVSRAGPGSVRVPFTDPGPTSESESARPPRRSVSVSRGTLSHNVLCTSLACALARLGGPCRRIPVQDRASQLRLGSGGGRLGPGQSCPFLASRSESVVSELEQAMGRRPGGSRPCDARAGAPGPWRGRCHRFSLQLTAGSESICVLGPHAHTHTHSAGRNREAHT